MNASVAITEDWHGTYGGYTNRACRCDECREANRLRQQRYRALNRAYPVPSSVKHGTLNCYTNYGCRCELCSEASRTAARRVVERNRRRPVPVHAHGTLNGYSNWSCRCADCRLANSTYAAARRIRKRDAS